MRSNFFSADGAIHITRAYDKPLKERCGTGYGANVKHTPKVIERMNRDRDVCLNCTKENCDGSDECFREQKKRR